MNRIHTKKISFCRQRARYVVTDWATSSLAFFVFDIYRYITHAGAMDMAGYLLDQKLVLEQILIPVAMLGIYWLSGFYNHPFHKSRLQEFITTFSSSAICTGLIYLLMLINDLTVRRTTSYEMIMALLIPLFIFVYIGRTFITSAALRHLKSHRWSFRTLIIGNSEKARKTSVSLTSPGSRLGYDILGYVNLPGEIPAENDGRPVFDLDEVGKLCESLNIDQLIISPEKYDDAEELKILYSLFSTEIPIKIAPDTLSFVTSGIRLQDIYAEPLVDLTSPRISDCSYNIKRSTDVITSAIALTLLSPVFLGIALAVRRSSPGPVIYRQTRIGKKQKPFTIYKFRTMRTDAEKEGPQLSSDSDPRITRIGAFLRKYRLDELPQFWNVLKGDMSLVGPRPEREFFIKQIVRQAPYYTLVHQVRPGITSWGMVKYGYASTVEQMVERTRYDLVYLSNMSIFVDLKILIHTVKTVVTGEGK